MVDEQRKIAEGSVRDPETLVCIEETRSRSKKICSNGCSMCIEGGMIFCGSTRERRRGRKRYRASSIRLKNCNKKMRLLERNVEDQRRSQARRRAPWLPLLFLQYCTRAISPEFTPKRVQAHGSIVETQQVSMSGNFAPDFAPLEGPVWRCICCSTRSWL